MAWVISCPLWALIYMYIKWGDEIELHEGMSQGTAMRNVKDVLETPPRTPFRKTPGRRSSPSHWRFGCFHLVDAEDPAPDSFLLHSTGVTGSLV